MAREREHRNGHLKEAMATLIQTQAAFVAQLADGRRETIEFDRETAQLRRETAERFARIEALLIEHNRILEALPETLREKIGFKVPEKS